jgi:hypothetical protein
MWLYLIKKIGGWAANFVFFPIDSPVAGSRILRSTSLGEGDMRKMELQDVQIVAGSVSSLLFISGNVPMLVKAFKTKNLRSYSLSNIILMNVGNFVYWFYVGNLPLGPIWMLHSFYTLAEVLMLVWFVRYEFRGTARRSRAAGLDPSATSQR